MQPDSTKAFSSCIWSRLRNSDGWRRADFWIFTDFQWILMEMGVLVHPQLGLRFGAALPGAFLFWEKTALFTNKHYFLWFSNDFSSEWTSFAIKSRNHYQNRHPDPCRILVGTLNPWNGRPRVVPWPILFERVAKKCPVNHHYSWVWTICYCRLRNMRWLSRTPGGPNHKKKNN